MYDITEVKARIASDFIERYYMEWADTETASVYDIYKSYINPDESFPYDMGDVFQVIASVRAVDVENAICELGESDLNMKNAERVARQICVRILNKMLTHCAAAPYCVDRRKLDREHLFRNLLAPLYRYVQDAPEK